MRRVTKLGYVQKKANASPVHSNEHIHWLLMYSDLRNFGFNPYVPEFAALIRSGRASRSQWRLMAPFVDFMLRHKVLMGQNVKRQMRWLGLRDDELRITRQRVRLLVHDGAHPERSCSIVERAWAGRPSAAGMKSSSTRLMFR